LTAATLYGVPPIIALPVISIVVRGAPMGRMSEELWQSNSIHPLSCETKL
jgi:hypothetical protein